VAQVGEQLPNKCKGKVLSSNARTAKKKKLKPRLKLSFLLSQHLELWDYRCVTLCLIPKYIFKWKK
jgi:hypothetical protein